MRILYVCNTYYHLITTIARMDLNNYNSVMLMDNMITNKQYYKLSRSKLFDEIIVEDSANFGIKKQIFKKTPLSRKWFKSFDSIYITSEEYSMGVFFYRSFIKYHLVEDGYNLFQFPSSDWRFDFRKWLTALLKFKVYKNSYGPCLSIEVNMIEGISNDRRFNKFVEFPRRDLISKMSYEKKKALFDIFELSSCFNLKGVKKALILTQPLYKGAGALFNSKEEQRYFYSLIALELREKGYEVYLKPHPRDNISYEIDFGKVIDKSVPMELIEFIDDMSFDIGITLYSTALDFLSCVKTKIFLLNKNQILKF